MATSAFSFKREILFDDLDGLLAARERLLTEGWDVQAHDSPDTGVRGFAAYRAGEDDTLLGCAVYGRALEPVIKVCGSWQEYVREIQFRLDEEMDQSPDTANRMVGFVAYGRAATAGVAEVFRLPLESLLSGGQEARASLIAVLLRAKHHPGTAGLEVLASRGR